MNQDLLDILSDGNQGIDNQKLVDYLCGNLSAAQRQEVEEMMRENAFMQEAMEGLGRVGNKNHSQQYVEQLNKNLQSQLEKKKNRREKRRLREYPWIYFTILLIILICLVGFFMIRQFLRIPH